MGYLSSNMLMIGAKLFSVDPTLFNPFENVNYMNQLKSYLCGPVDMDKPHKKDVGLNCIYFLVMQKKHCLKEYLIQKPENHCLLEAVLHVAKTTSVDHRISFVKVLTMLFRDTDPDLIDIEKLILSNLCSP